MAKKEKTYKKNNLKNSNSPYLKQHADNPVWWQELNLDVLEFAKKENKPILLSSGYSTCHWCHVMAKDAFSHKETADFLNKYFICVKIDREIQPDIDSWMISYLQKETGQGGWPMNIFVNYEFKPFFAMMFAPSQEGSYGRPSFLRIIKKIYNQYNANGFSLKKWDSSNISSGSTSMHNYSDDKERVMMMTGYFDNENGGLKGNQKFPPHNTLHFLLSVNHGLAKVDDFVRFTLANMHLSGLHDHLQGGFYRYCVDKNWEIPHFEKMLYDQAMMLMNYSLAFFKYQAEGYKDAVNGIIKCLNETFEINGLYASAHDADTNHIEGLTYLWTNEELNQYLSENEYDTLKSFYEFVDFENRYHLIKKKTENNQKLKAVEQKLLKIRKSKTQAFRDEKIITSWNALAGIALILSARYANTGTYEKAKLIFENILNLHQNKNGTIRHSSYKGKVQNASFLQDVASILLFATYLYEDRLINKEQMKEIYSKIHHFKQNGVWYESVDGLLGKVNAETYDHPYPSSVSMANAGIARYKLLIGELPNNLHFNPPLSHDYYNLAVKWSRGEFPVIKSPKTLPYTIISPGTLQTKDNKLSICYNTTCKEVNFEELKNLKELKSI